MTIKPIKTDQDYDDALDEIESLFASDPGSDDADRLEVLVVLAQDYQRTHFPVSPPDVQSAVEHELDKRGFTRQGTGTGRAEISGVEAVRSGANQSPSRTRRTRQTI